MPEKEERTFYFYSDGYLPQELNLGHLVFGSYVRPTKGHQCSMEPLSEEELDTWALVQPRTSICYSSASFREFGFSATVIDMVTVGMSVSKDTQHAVVSERCRRITLKDSEKFLSEKVFKVDSIGRKVQEWLSVTTNEYAKLRLMPLRWWPKIWMLTGIYEFEDCTSFAWRKNEVSVEASVAAEIMALLNVPLGASISANNSRNLYSKQTFPGKSIWAAEYQLVDAKFCRVSSNKRDKPTLPIELPLRLKVIYSGGGTRTGKSTRVEEKEKNNMAMLTLADEVSSGQGDASEFEDKFWAEFEEVEETWMEDGIDIDG